MIAPAISVLSAAMPYVMPIAAVILVSLFSIQSRAAALLVSY
jgi:K+ transporter